MNNFQFQSSIFKGQLRELLDLKDESCHRRFIAASCQTSYDRKKLLEAEDKFFEAHDLFLSTWEKALAL